MAVARRPRRVELLPVLKVRAAAMVSLLAAACKEVPGTAYEWRFSAPITLSVPGDDPGLIVPLLMKAASLTIRVPPPRMKAARRKPAFVFGGPEL